ncbi:unnamed protein product [Parnassius mnemosyne]|uniref:Fucosyltransferase n=1 Tax=Parnassius mnemosyne TaxID=213953 RepID=A0AAV1LQA7_9NEOP
MHIFKRIFNNKRLSINKFIALVGFCAFLLLVYQYDFYRETTGLSQDSRKNSKFNVWNSFPEVQLHREVINSFYEKRQTWRTSNLGSVLFKNVESDAFIKEYNKNRTFVILIWKYWDWLQNRHLYSFGTTRVDVSLVGCSVKNCRFTKNEQDLKIADAVVVHLQHGQFPDSRKRTSHQKWVFLSDESPRNTFSLAKRQPKLQELSQVFNWSMTYRSDSDVPVPYGRTQPLPEALSVELTKKTTIDLIPNWNKKRRDVLAAILISNCAVSHRMAYIKELRKHLDVDVHGRCSENLKNSCPGHFRSDCPIISEYLFYLVLENSMCREYLTEKAFYHAYYKGAIPVIMGPSIEDCEQLLPPNSFLHVDNYATPRDLAEEITRLSNDIPRLLTFHEWRRHFEILNEHGYFGSKSRHYCRLCEALNYNDAAVKVYDEDDLKNFLDPSLVCR